MTKAIHAAYVLLLILAFLLAAGAIGVRGCGYYLTSLEARPYHPLYDTLKPTGFEGHGYGIIGSVFLIVGVAMYSARKRMRMFGGLGKIKYYLEFHIFLCLIGPLLVVYHTTFKFGGLVAVSFWSMVAVVLSGVIGRYLYVQIPKGIQGNELTVADLENENRSLSETLRLQYGLDPAFLQSIDAAALPARSAAGMSMLEVMNFYIVNDFTRRRQLRAVYRALGQKIDRHAMRSIRRIARRRIILTRRIAFLRQFREMFHYWHVIHLPFAVIMFIILFIHVAVAVAFGYTWIW